MNIIFLKGKIISKIEYEFIINNINNAIVIFKIQVEDNIIIIKGYDEIADFCYRKLGVGQEIYLQGRINSKMEIIIQEIYISK